MREVESGRLVARDADTNAIIPVMQAYSADTPDKQVIGNRLIVRDADTNAIIPVVEVLGQDMSSILSDMEKLKNKWRKVGVIPNFSDMEEGVFYYTTEL